MKITINDRRKVHAIQQEFTEKFPQLKIEFLAKPQRAGGSASHKTVKDGARRIGDCRTIHDSGTITIEPEMTVAELVQNFRDMYGLSVRVFRRSGRLWLGTNVTGNWTLYEQNMQASLSGVSGEADKHQAVR